MDPSQERLDALERLYQADQLPPEMKAAYERVRPTVTVQPPDNPMTGAAKAFGSGIINQGIPDIVGLPGDIAQKAGEAFDAVTGTKKPEEGASPNQVQEAPTDFMSGDEAYASAIQRFGASLPTSEDVGGAISKVIPEYEPQNFLEKGLKATGRMAPASLLGPAKGAQGVLGDFARYAVAPGFVSEGAAALNPFGHDEYVKAGAMLATPWLAGKAITPYAASPKNIEAAKALRGEGGVPNIRVTPGQVAANKSRIGLETGLDPELYQKQLEQFTSRAGSTIGLNDPRLETGIDNYGREGNFTKRYREIKEGFDDLAAKYPLQSDQQLIGDLQNVMNKKVSSPGTYTPEEIDNTVNAVHRIWEALSSSPSVINPSTTWTTGKLTGPQYQQLRTSLRSAGEGDIVQALDDAMTRSVKNAGGDPEAYAKQRELYVNANVLKDALGHSNEYVNQGLIPPEILDRSARTLGGKYYETGKDAFSHFTKPAVPLLKKPPENSDVFGQSSKSIGALVGALAGKLMPGGSDERSVLGLLGGSEAAQPAIQALMKADGRKVLTPEQLDWYWGNQVLPKAGMQGDNAKRLMMIRALSEAKGKGDEAQ